MATLTNVRTNVKMESGYILSTRRKRRRMEHSKELYEQMWLKMNLSREFEEEVQ